MKDRLLKQTYGFEDAIFRQMFVQHFVERAVASVDCCKLIFQKMIRKFHKLECTMKSETQMTCNLIHVNWYNFNFLN